MIRSILFALSLILSITNLAASEDYYFSGYLGAEGYVNVYLRVNERAISGWFRISSQNESRPISGDRNNGDNNWILVEKNQNHRELSRFTGEFNEGHYLGQWNSGARMEDFDLQLRMEVAEISLHREEYINIQNQYPYFHLPDEKEVFNQTFFEKAMSDLSSFYEWMDPGFNESAPLLSQSNVAAEFLGPKWISLIFETFQYTGGAHGNSYYLCRNFQMINGEWQEQDLMTLLRSPSELESLRGMVIAALLDEGATWTDELDPANGFLKHFTLNPQGISFYFQPYEVGSYAEGSYRVFIPWEDSKELWDIHLLNHFKQLSEQE